MIQTRVKENFYQDSVKLMRIASSIRNMEGVEEASVSMATPTNLELLERIGILTPEAQAASPDDILIVVRAASEEQCHAALEAAESGWPWRRTEIPSRPPRAWSGRWIICRRPISP